MNTNTTKLGFKKKDVDSFHKLQRHMAGLVWEKYGSHANVFVSEQPKIAVHVVFSKNHKSIDLDELNAFIKESARRYIWEGS